MITFYLVFKAPPSLQGYNKLQKLAFISFQVKINLIEGFLKGLALLIEFCNSLASFVFFLQFGLD